jgi:hypothetical protein
MIGKPVFDMTINLGHVITVAIGLLALGTAYTTYQVTINDHDSRLRSLEKNGVANESKVYDMYNVLYSIKNDISIIKFRLDRDDKK